MADIEEEIGEKVTIYPVTRITGRAEIELSFNPAEVMNSARFRALGLRGFDRMLVGMPALRAPQFTSRVCGWCGPFHQLASCLAIERATGTEVPPPAKIAREVLCWLWIAHAHLLRFTYQVLPDLALPMSDAAVRNVAGIYKVEEEVVRRLAAVQSVLFQAITSIAGLPVHPSLIVPGGVSSLPPGGVVENVADGLSRIEEDLRETLRLVEMLMNRASQMIYTGIPLSGYYMAVTEDGCSDLLGDTITAAPFGGGEGTRFSVAEFEEVLKDRPVDWSYLVPVSVDDLGDVLTGPLARANVGFGADTPWAREECEACRRHWGAPMDREFLNYMGMMLEVIWAWEKAKNLLDKLSSDGGRACNAPEIKRSSGTAVVGTPGGTLLHSVVMNEEGGLESYRIVSPLQMNYSLLNRLLFGVARKVVTGIEIPEAVSQRLQLAVRAFNPCVPCGTH